ncbi:MAG: hypothetical protein U1F43_17035 [Myxococcota bacterium]
MSFDEGEAALRPGGPGGGAAVQREEAKGAGAAAASKTPPVETKDAAAVAKGAPAETKDAAAATKDTAAEAKGAAAETKDAAAEAKGAGAAKSPEAGIVPAATRSPVMSKDASRALLDGAFGSYKKISAGNVRVLPEADFRKSYDDIYGSTNYAWAKYVVPRYGSLNGFAYGGVNYINQDRADVTTTPHEMLHSNTAPDFINVVGNPFTEGTTEYLEQYALRVGKVPSSAMSHYPEERKVVDAFLASGRSESDLFTAYLKGGAATLVKAHVDASCTKTWEQVKASTIASKWAEARAGLAKKGGEKKAEAPAAEKKTEAPAPPAAAEKKRRTQPEGAT